MEKHYSSGIVIRSDNDVLWLDVRQHCLPIYVASYIPTGTTNPQDRANTMISQHKIGITTIETSARAFRITLQLDDNITLTCVCNAGKTSITYAPALTVIELRSLLSVVEDHIPITFKHNEVRFKYLDE